MNNSTFRYINPAALVWGGNLNQCLNAANALLRSDNPVVADAVEAIIKRAFKLGQSDSNLNGETE